MRTNFMPMHQRLDDGPLARLPGDISRSPERLIVAYYAIDVPVVPVLLFEVRPAKQEYEGDVYDAGGGCGRDGSRLLQPTKLDILMDGV